MSVSIDEHPSDHESAQSVLAGWLDDFQAGRCERADLEEAFISVCSNDPEAPWDALSLLDRYQRLGRVDADLARELKSRISQIAVGAPAAADAHAPPKGVTSGTRWRKAVAEHDAESSHTDDIEPAPTAVRSPAKDEALAPRIPLRDAEADEEEVEEDEEDEESLDPAPTGAPGASRSTFAERAHEIRKTSDDVRKTSERREQPAPIVQRARSAPPSSAPRPAPAPAIRSPSASGPRVLRERYELLSVLSRGGTSTVYKALDRHRANLSESARYVAVKVLNATYDSHPEALAELEREFHQAQSLSHPNIASVFDLDRDGSTYFIVMELLEGESLASVLRRLAGQPMARKNALAVIGAIGAALAHAHRREIVHGDLKPRNVMITWSGEVRVIEFGFARAGTMQHGELDAEHGSVSIGTPAYASAERVHGMDPDPSDDVYSLACIAYELLSGRHPYGGRSAFLARAHGRRAQRAPGLTHSQWHALQRALAWDRADRKIDIVDLLGALGTSEAGQDAVPPELLSIPDDVRGRRLRKLGAVAAVLLVVALAFYFVTRIPPPVQSVDVGALPIPTPTEKKPQSPQTETSDGAPTQSAGSNVQSAARPAEPPTAASAPEQTESRPQASARSEETVPAQVSRPSAPAPVGAPPATIGFAKDTFVVTESDSAVSLEVKRSGSASRAISFRWSLRSNSAEASSDFAAIGPGVEQIPAGARSATILIPIVSDAIVENTELFLVELEPMGEGVALGELAHAAVIIVDDD